MMATRFVAALVAACSRWCVFASIEPRPVIEHIAAYLNQQVFKFT
jgi:hypothetical protein